MRTGLPTRGATALAAAVLAVSLSACGGSDTADQRRTDQMEQGNDVEQELDAGNNGDQDEPDPEAPVEPGGAE